MNVIFYIESKNGGDWVMTASSRRKNMFNEATRVQMPALVHLTKLGYTYFGKISEEMAETVYEPDTNILIEVFKKAI